MEYQRRVIFLHNHQTIFLKDIQSNLGLTSNELSKIAEVSARSFRDWKKEKYSIPLPVLERFCKLAKVPLPKNIEIRDPFWYTSEGSRKGGLARYKKYGCVGGSPEYRKKKWFEWWERKGKFQKHPIINVCSPIKIPLHSLKLAELVGIILGDGGITNYQLSITLNKHDDKDFAIYVKDLITKLFNVKPSFYDCQKNKQESVISIVVSRVKLVHFFVNMGLCVGSKVKNQVGVPAWINQSPNFIKACLRGMFDTDGCFYIERHYYKDKVYLNCAMSFSNYSLPLLVFFKNSLEKFNFHPTNSGSHNITLRKEGEILRYFLEIKSSNSKHLNKFQKYFQDKYGEVPKRS